MKYFTFLFFALFCVSLNLELDAQDRPFIYMEDGQFYEGCDSYYPMIVNYHILFEDSLGYYRITPVQSHCEKIKNCNTCGVSATDYKNKIAEHFKTMVKMGFNTVRVVGLAVRQEIREGDDGRKKKVLASKQYFIQNQNNPNCHKLIQQGMNIQNKEDYERHGDLIQQVFDIIHEEKIPLRIMLASGGHGVEDMVKEYADYLSYLAERFKEETALFAFDLYNEPGYEEVIKTADFSKYDRAEWFASWYNAIKEKSPTHFVTYGPVVTDVFEWDPEIIPTDFFAIHIYSHSKEHYGWDYNKAFNAYKSFFKYAGKHFTKPWIVGETGYPGIDDNFIKSGNMHPVVGSEAEQKHFAENSMKYSRWYGAQGYSWWRFKDTFWGPDDSEYGAIQHYKGAVYYRENNDWKPCAYTFKEFDPFAKCTDCADPPEEEYYNLFYNPYPVFEGRVVDRNNSAKGIGNAVVKATIGKKGGREQNNECLTFTDPNGNFVLRSVYKDRKMIVKKIKISAPGMNTYMSENWTNGLKNEMFALQQLDVSQLPLTLSFPEEQKITKRKSQVWRHKQIMQARYLIIGRGAKLTVTDTIYVKPGTTIRVEKGGTLLINGGAFIGLCEWGGILVEDSGSELASEDLPNGRVILKGDAKIENSRFGIKKIVTENRDSR